MTFNCQPFVKRDRLSTGFASGFTMTLKLCVALIGGVPLSVTFTVVKLVVFACATAGRQVKTPLLPFSAAPVGAANKLNVSVCAGVSESVATLVIVSVTPALTVRPETGDNTGGLLLAATTSVIFVLCVRPLLELMPLIMMVFVPSGVELEVVMVRTELDELPVSFGNDGGVKL